MSNWDSYGCTALDSSHVAKTVLQMLMPQGNTSKVDFLIFISYVLYNRRGSLIYINLISHLFAMII